MSGGAAGASGGVCKEGDHVCPDDASCKCGGAICVKFCASCDRKCSKTCSSDADCRSIGGASGAAWRCVSYPDGKWCWF